MGHMSELHAAVPDALGLAIGALRREAEDMDRRVERAVRLKEHWRRAAQANRDAIETLTLLAEVLAMPVVPVTYFGDVEEGLTPRADVNA